EKASETNIHPKVAKNAPEIISLNFNGRFGATQYKKVNTIKRIAALTIQRIPFQISKNSSDKPNDENIKTPICFPKTGSNKATMITKIMPNVNNTEIPLV